MSAAYGDGGGFRGSLGQLAINVAALLVAGTLTLAAQRAVYARRLAAHARARASMPAADAHGRTVGRPADQSGGRW